MIDVLKTGGLRQGSVELQYLSWWRSNLMLNVWYYFRIFLLKDEELFGLVYNS